MANGGVQGIKVSDGACAYIDEEEVCRLNNCVLEISHPVSLKEGKLTKVHKDLKYKVKLDGMPLKRVLEGFAADLRIALAGDFRKTSDEFVDSIKGQEYTLAGLQAEIALARTDLDDEALEQQIERLIAIRNKRMEKQAGKTTDPTA